MSAITRWRAVSFIEECYLADRLAGSPYDATIEEILLVHASVPAGKSHEAQRVHRQSYPAQDAIVIAHESARWRELSPWTLNSAVSNTVGD